MGSLKRPGTTSYRLSIDTIALSCLVFEKNRVFYCALAYWCAILVLSVRLSVHLSIHNAHDENGWTYRQTVIQSIRQTNGQHRCTKPPSLLHQSPTRAVVHRNSAIFEHVSASDHKHYMMTSRKVQVLSCWRTKKETYKQPQTDWTTDAWLVITAECAQRRHGLNYKWKIW